MKDFSKYMGLLVLLTIANSSCNKALDALPKNTIVEANIITDQNTAQKALTGVYYNFANASHAGNDWIKHQQMPASLAGYLRYGTSLGPSDLNLNYDYNHASYGYWAESYKILNAANGLIKGVNALAGEKFTGTRKNELLGEAYFLRAYAHFKLLIFYSEWYKPGSSQGVLLRDELSNLTNIAKARSNVKDSYDFVIADLDKSIAYAPAVNQNYYATKWAAMALKMRVLTCRGGVGDFAEVINLADTIIQKSPFELETNAEDIFHKKGLNSREVILGLIPEDVQVADPYSKSRKYYPGSSDIYVATPALKDLYVNDPRAAWMTGTATTYAPNTFWFMKFILQGGDPSIVSETDYVLRLTEVYLLKAEAIVRSGRRMEDAKLLLHIIQGKAGITATVNNTNYLAIEHANTTDSLLLEIYKETARSLVAEDGIEWTALLRLPFARIQEIKPTITSMDQYILPVPYSEFLYNGLFGDQNTGYSKK